MEPDYDDMATDKIASIQDDAPMGATRILSDDQKIAAAQVYATLVVMQAVDRLGIELRDIKDRLETIGNQVYLARTNGGRS